MKKNKLITIAVIVLTMIISSTAAFAATVPSDVKGLDCETAVKALMEKEVITGDTDGLFHPEQSLTRAQISLMIAKAIDPAILTNPAYGDAVYSFSDLDGYGWAEYAINYASVTGIMKGYGDGTCRPGNNLTLAELLTLVVRACGYSDSQLTGAWPQNYVDKALELNLIDTKELLSSSYASKAQAAMVLYNALDMIKKAAGETELDDADFMYDNIKFSSDFKTINGKELSEDFVLYTYGKSSSYSSDMKLPDHVSALKTANLYMYKNVSTKGWYKTVNGKIAAVIVPENTGFSGKVYGALNSLATSSSKNTNVQALNMLTSSHEIQWLCREGVSTNQTAVNTAIQNGDLIQLTVSKGAVSMIVIGVENMTSDYPVELGVAPSMTGSWQEVTDINRDRQLLQLSNDEYIGYADSDSISLYILNDDGTKYESAKVSDVKKGYKVRMYDAADDDEDEANIIFIKKN